MTADDAGIDPSRNRGIFRALEAGLLKNISIIVNQAGWQDLLVRLKTFAEVATGLHLNLTAGRPLASGLSTLVDPEGKFFNKFELLKKVLEGSIEVQEVRKEFQAQWDFFRGAGLSASHFDGHHHIHVWPGIAQVFAQVVPHRAWVRRPCKKGILAIGPQLYEGTDLLLTDLNRLQKVLNFWCLQSDGIWQRQFRTVDDFGGASLSDAPTLGGFQREIANLDGEVCEFMCHPGDEWDEDSVRFSKLMARQIERDILCSAELKLFLRNLPANTVSYKDLS